MTIKEFRIFIKQIYKRVLLLSFSLALIVSLFSYLLPKSFISEGTFILIPNLQNSKNENIKNIYNYDGYYLDQISQSYSKTILGLIETPEFKKKISDDNGIENNYKSLFLLNFNSNFKEIAPRVLVLNVKSNSYENSEKMFKTYEKNILYFADRYNSEKVFKLERLDKTINTFENTVSVYVYFITTFFFVSFVYTSIKFLKENKK